MITSGKKTIHIFGNPLLDFDNLPLRLAPGLRKAFPGMDFVITDPNENLKPANGELIIIDTIEGIKKVTVLDDIEKIQSGKIYSLHDFDLSLTLKLLRKIGKLKKIKIIGVPMKIAIDNALAQITKEIDCLKN